MRIGILIAAFCTVLVLSYSPHATRAQAADDDELKRIVERLELLETTVLRDAYHPSRTVVSRLTDAEKEIEDLQKSVTATVKTDAKDNAALRDALTALQKESDQLSRRTKSLEDQLGKHGDNRELTEIKRAMDRFERTLDDLESRIDRLENRR